MNLFLSILTFMTFTVYAHAGVVTKIFKVEAPENKSENYHVLALHNGQVFEVDRKNPQLVHKLQRAAQERAAVELELESNLPLKSEYAIEQIVDAVLLPTPVNPDSPALGLSEEFTPTNIKNLAKAKQMFSELLPANKWGDQCFNRAHIWNRQMHKDHRVKSEKIFIFYTRKYRREINGKWWFHTAPMITLQGQKTVMDKEFTNGPLSTADWEKIFNVPMQRDGYRCKFIEGISEYYNESNDQSEYCNIQYSSMYYWEPSELEDLEEEGLEKTKWVDWEIRLAAKAIFWSWKSVYQKYRP
ncbi:MAG: protein-glutamine glutaminase family protein [Bacteriovoracaceae bacterium]